MDKERLNELIKQTAESDFSFPSDITEEQRELFEKSNAQFEQLVKETAGISSQEEMLNMTATQLDAVNDRLIELLKETLGDETYAEIAAFEKQMRERGRSSAEDTSADPELTAAIKKVTRNAIYVNYEKNITDIPAGNTKFGGKPDVPADFEWFRTSDGRPLAFLAQFNLNELHEYDRKNELPASGILYFFYDLEQMPWDNLEPDENCIKVYYFNGSVSELSPAEFPDDIDSECIIKQCGLSFQTDPDAPSYEDFEAVSDFPCDDYLIYNSSAVKALGFDPYYRDDIRFKLLGYADIIQNSVLEEFAFNDENDDWVLLAQFDTYENGSSYIMYCDGGRIYFGIRKQDLAEGNFDNIRLILQCF